MITFTGTTNYSNLDMAIDLGNTVNVRTATINSFNPSTVGAISASDIQGQSGFTLVGTLDGATIVGAGSDTILTNVAPGHQHSLELTTSAADLTITKRHLASSVDQLSYTSSSFVISSTFTFVITWEQASNTVKLYRGFTLVDTSTAGVGGIFDHGSEWTLSSNFTVTAVYNTELTQEQITTLVSAL